MGFCTRDRKLEFAERPDLHLLSSLASMVVWHSPTSDPQTHPSIPPQYTEDEALQIRQRRHAGQRRRMARRAQHYPMMQRLFVLNSMIVFPKNFWFQTEATLNPNL